MGDVVGSVIGGIAGGSPSQPNLNVFQPSGTQAADQQYSSLLNQNVNPYAQYAPQYQSVYNNQYNNPYAAGQQTAANTAGQQYGQVGAQNVGASNLLNSSALSVLPGAQQVMQMGLDPQNALYNRTAQQTQDQSRVANAAAGTQNSPYGAAVEGQNMNNFNIDWQNNALQRAMSGLQSGTSAIQGATTAATGAGNLGTAGAGNTLQGGTVPYSTSMGQSQNQYAALNELMSGLTGGNQINQQTLSEIMPYLNLGANQSNQQANLNQQSYQNQLQQSQSASALGGTLGGDLFGTGGSSLFAPMSFLGF